MLRMRVLQVFFFHAASYTPQSLHGLRGKSSKGLCTPSSHHRVTPCFKKKITENSSVGITVNKNLNYRNEAAACVIHWIGVANDVAAMAVSTSVKIDEY